MTLRGIDVSKYQSVTPSLAGLSFAFARATYATTADPKYAMHIRNFRKAGIVTGAYHFGVGYVSPTAQASVFLATAKDADLLVLDLEFDRTKTMSLTQARAFIKAVQASGRRIGLYHSLSSFPNIGQDFNWVAYWGPSQPPIPWTFWQYRGSPLDLDLFNGNESKLRLLAGALPDTATEGPLTISAGDDLNYGWESWTLDGTHTVYSIGGPRLDDGSTDPDLRLCFAGPGSRVVTFVDRKRLTSGKKVSASDALLAVLTSGDLADVTAAVNAALDHVSPTVKAVQTAIEEARPR